jgi:hypothetical protein
MAGGKVPLFVVAVLWLLLFIGGTYAQIGTTFMFDKVLAAAAFGIVNVVGIVLYLTVFRMKGIPVGLFVISALFVGMAAAAGAWGA